MWSSSFFFSIPGYGLFSSLLRFFLLFTNSIVTELYHVSNHCPFTLFSIKRLFWLSLFLIVLPLLMIWNHLGFWLDNWFFPKWKEVNVKNPLFLIGNARSGTTWLHRVISESDSKTTFTTLKTWEILFAVSITWRVLFHILFYLDRLCCFGLWYRLLTTCEYLLVGNIAIHPIGLLKAEEDEWLMMHIGLAQLLLFFFPSSSNMMNPLILFDYHSDMLEAIRESATADLLSSNSSQQQGSSFFSEGNSQARSRSNSMAGSGSSTTTTSSSANTSSSSFSSSTTTTNSSSSSANDARHQSLLQTFYYISQQERGKGNMLTLAHRFGIFSYYKECVQRHLYFHAYVKEDLTSIMTIRNLPMKVMNKLPIPQGLSSLLFGKNSSSSSPMPSPSASSSAYSFNGFMKHHHSSTSTSSSNKAGLTPSLVFVSKNPAFTLRIPTIYATFPDAKIVCLLRDPIQSIPSMVSYISHVWHVFNNPKEKFPNVQELLGFCEAHYLFPLLHLHASVKPNSQWSFLSYHACRDNLKYHVLSMLSRLFDSQQFHRMTNDTISNALTKEQMNTKNFVTSHEYNFSECCKGLTEESLRKSLEVVYLAHRGAFPVSSSFPLPPLPPGSSPRVGRPLR